MYITGGPPHNGDGLVAVDVNVGVGEGVCVAVEVGVNVKVGVAVGGSITFNAPHPTKPGNNMKYPSSKIARLKR